MIWLYNRSLNKLAIEIYIYTKNFEISCILEVWKKLSTVLDYWRPKYTLTLNDTEAHYQLNFRRVHIDQNLSEF